MHVPTGYQLSACMCRHCWSVGICVPTDLCMSTFVCRPFAVCRHACADGLPGVGMYVPTLLVCRHMCADGSVYVGMYVPTIRCLSACMCRRIAVCRHARADGLPFVGMYVPTLLVCRHMCADGSVCVGMYVPTIRCLSACLCRHTPPINTYLPIHHVRRHVLANRHPDIPGLIGTQICRLSLGILHKPRTTSAVMYFRIIRFLAKFMRFSPLMDLTELSYFIFIVVHSGDIVPGPQQIGRMIPARPLPHHSTTVLGTGWFLVQSVFDLGCLSSRLVWNSGDEYKRTADLARQTRLDIALSLGQTSDHLVAVLDDHR
jgi:hypothetical protein